MIRLEPMSGVERARYEGRMLDAYAAELVEATGVSGEEARAIAETHLALDTEEQEAEQCLHIVAAQSGETVGEAAVVLGGEDAFLLDFRIDDAHQGRGYGSAAMRRIERMATDAGASQIRLHVFARNGGARSLYERRGFEIVSLQMRKSLG